MSQNTTYPVQPLQNQFQTHPTSGDCLRAQLGQWEIMLRGPSGGLTDALEEAFHALVVVVRQAVREAKKP